MGLVSYVKVATVIGGIIIGYGVANASTYTNSYAELIPREVEVCESSGGESLACAIALEKNQEREFLSAFMAADAVQQRIMRSMVTRATMRCSERADVFTRSLCTSGAYKDAVKVLFPDRWE